MKKKVLRLIGVSVLVPFILMSTSLAADQGVDQVFGELDITGFFDVVGTYQSSQDDQTEFGLGQAEIDVEKQMSDITSIAVAVAYNNEAGSFELGCAELGQRSLVGPQEQADGRGVLAKNANAGSDEAREFVLLVCLAFQNRPHHQQNVTCDGIHDLAVELLLAVEELVQRSCGELRLGRDFVHGDIVETLLREELHRNVQNLSLELVS